MLALLLGAILSIVHFFSESIHISFPEHRMKIVSFSSGLFVTYLFIHLLPLLYRQTQIEIEISMISVLFGFTVFHIIEKYIYKHESRPVVLKKEMKEVHSIAFFIYHLMIGMVIVKLAELSMADTALFFVPILFITAIGSVSMKYLYASKNLQVKVLLSISTFIGTVVAFFMNIPEIIFISILGFMIGTLMYIIIMDAIPKEREGEPVFFIIGLLVYMTIIMFTWFI
ncbi:MAG: hypothetical protein V3V26_02370 [Candidatus Aenigmarchaeota archaeon]